MFTDDNTNYTNIHARHGRNIFPGCGVAGQTADTVLAHVPRTPHKLFYAVRGDTPKREKKDPLSDRIINTSSVCIIHGDSVTRPRTPPSNERTNTTRNERKKKPSLCYGYGNIERTSQEKQLSTLGSKFSRLIASAKTHKRHE